MTTLLFVGDLTGEAGLVYLEQHLPALIARHQADFVVVNGENMELAFHPNTMGPCGMSPAGLARLFALGVDLVTGGNHSWDGPGWQAIYDDARVIRPLNYGQHAPGAGSAILTKHGVRLGVMNLVSRTALRLADDPLAAFEMQRDAWGDSVDAILVDFHGESVTEKMIFGFAVDGQAMAVLGTHTHVATLDTRLLPEGTAYVTDVGMTGPGGGMQGYQPLMFVQSMRTRLPGTAANGFATGEVELGAVVVEFTGNRATAITRILQ